MFRSAWRVAESIARICQFSVIVRNDFSVMVVSDGRFFFSLIRHCHRKSITLNTETFVKETRISDSAEAVYNWHTRRGAFERLKPPWEKMELVSVDNGINEGSQVELRLRFGPFRKKWIAEIHDCKQGREFCDTQSVGPFAFWEHRHKMLPDRENACRLQDRIEYTIPFGTVGRLLGSRLIRRKLERVFEYRHRLTLQDIHLQKQLREFKSLQDNGLQD
jgi:ligand-binding SRPBCC domain-containing protein